MLIGGIVSAVTQTDFYVSSLGNDSNPGTISQPWLTVSKANTHTWAPGETINFRGGGTFAGGLIVNPSSQPGSSTRIIVSSYGTGQATLTCGGAFGVKLVNTGYVTVSNLKFVGSGFTGQDFAFNGSTVTTTIPAPNVAGGSAAIWCTSDTQSVNYAGIIIDGNTIDGCGDGIEVVNTHTSCTAAGTGWQITNNSVHNIPFYGIYVHGYLGNTGEFTNRIFSNFSILNNDIDYVPGAGPDGGVVVMLFNCSAFEVAGNRQGHSGWGTIGLPVSTLLVYCDDIWIHHNEVHHFTHGPGGGDGKGIDPDIDSVRTLVEYNYVHDSDRAGLFNFAGAGTIWRYNVVERCNQCLIGAAGPQTIYNNTFYNNTDQAPIDIGFAAAVIYNNVIVGKSGVTLMQITPGSTTVIGNAYQTTGGSSFIVTEILGSTFTSLSDFRAGGYEKRSGTDYGVLGTMNFTNAGNGTQQLPTNPVSHLSAYDIATGSAAIGAGLDLSAVGITEPTTDWHGNAAFIDTRDSGAVRSGSTAS